MHGAAGTAPEAPLRIWGLDAIALHDAYWASYGVQCVRRGSGVEPQVGADLFLLVEPGQFVIFDLRSIAEILLWSRADLTRVQLVSDEVDDYGERIVQDAHGGVARIERRYAPSRTGQGQVLLARRAARARAWAASGTAAEAYSRMRRGRGPRIDAIECAGRRILSGGRSSDEEAVRLIADRWPHPERVIEGIAQFREGVFGRAGEDLEADDRCVGPLWIGARPGDRPSIELIGPAAVADAAAVAPHRVRPIEEIFSPESIERVETERRTRDGLYGPLKRALDVVVAICVLVLGLPVLLACAVAVVIDDGFPVFFGHRRQLRGGGTFRCWKFRTMRRDAEARVAELRQQNLCDGPQVFIRDDPRVTRVGRLLRRLQLDELPQFWNVLVGEMSLVGPRPSPEKENQFCPAWREMRLSVRPGITGLWQVMRTREPGKDFQEWIRYDIDYVRRMGPWLDLRILVQTVWTVLGPGQGAPDPADGAGGGAGGDGATTDKT